MEIITRDEGSVAIMTISGEIDLYNAAEVKEAIQKFVDEKKYKVIVNMGGVSYVDSSGIGSLISSFSNLKKFQGSLRICNVAGSVRKVFELTRLTSFFDIDDTEEDSLAALK